MPADTAAAVDMAVVDTAAVDTASAVGTAAAVAVDTAAAAAVDTAAAADTVAADYCLRAVPYCLIGCYTLPFFSLLILFLRCFRFFLSIVQIRLQQF